eukprot:GHVQ01038431.1.p1 GENE.GHVQ01038431.1~~GHVQ01038431.1.p1  ORF type:complete len:120 (+),score=13.81 GHVQ01038431.1:88-447(+)
MMIFVNDGYGGKHALGSGIPYTVLDYLMTGSLTLYRRVREWKRRWLLQGKQQLIVRRKCTGGLLAVIIQCSFFFLPFVTPVACWSVFDQKVPKAEAPDNSGFDKDEAPDQQIIRQAGFV